MLLSVRPVAAQTGQTSEHEVSARYNLYGAYKVLVSGDGVTGEVVQPEKKEGEKPPEKKPNVPKIKVRFTVAPDAVPGVRDFRIATPQGVSTLGQLVVARDPVTSEAADNNTPAKAQAVTIPATLCGAIETAEDIDYFKFHADAGTSLTFHVRAKRLEDRIHDLQVQVDPMITLRSAAGNTLAVCDNYFGPDPLLYYKFDQAGDYLLEIRDVRYQGNNDWVYSIEINNRPFVTQVHPLTVAAGTETKLSLVGFNLPADAATTLKLPPNTEPGLRCVSPPVGNQPVNAFPVLVTPLPAVLKTAASDSPPAAGQTPPGSPSGAPAAQPFTVPTAINGRIEKPGDIDRYTLEAKAGETFSIEVMARRAQSQLDSFVRILNAQGGAVSESDDLQVHRFRHADSWLENWSAPADGKYTIELRDAHLRGGPQFTYALAVTRSQPHFTLEIDTDKTLLAPGTAAPLYVRVNRKNGFVGAVQLATAGLPKGVSATCGRILESSQDGCIILQAAADAPADVANIRVTGTATHPVKDAAPLELSAVARPLQEVYSPGGGRTHFAVDMHTVSVAEPMDIRSVKLSTAAVTLKASESQRIDVTIERAAGFKGNVTLDVLYQHLETHYGNSLPKGVAIDLANSKTLLTGEETKGHITLKAAADAPAVEKQLVPVMAHVSVNFVMKMTYCGEPVFITVVAPPK